MGDTFGNLTFPVATPPLTATDAPGDPLLTVFGAFLKATVNAACGTAWATLYPTESPVLSVHFEDPSDSEVEFTDRDLPALFCFRRSQNIERIADDWQSDRSDVVVLWIPPPSEMSRATERKPFANAIAKAMARALGRSRDPAWIADGDDDTNATLRGSNLTAEAGLLRLVDTVRVSTVPVVIEVQGSDPCRYRAAQALIETHELLEQGASDYPDIYPAQLHADINEADGSTRVHVTPGATLIDGGLAASTDADYAGALFDAGIP